MERYSAVTKYFHRYLKEIEFRFNHREIDLFHSIAKMLVKSAPNV